MNGTELHPAPGPGPVHRVRIGLWGNGDFLKLWAGQSISLLGSQITLLALPLTAILLFRASTFQVGLLGAVQFLPFLLFGLPAGVWVDRLRRKPILVAADVGRFLILVSIPVAYALGELHLAHLFVAGFLSGVLTLLFDVAYGAYLPSLTERDRLVEANSKLEISRSGAHLAGPGLAGVLVEAFRAPMAILADALSYLASVVSLILIRRKELPIPVPQGETSRMRRQIGEGVRYVVGNPLLRPLAACVAMLNLFGTMAETVILVFAVRELGLSPGTIGVVFTVGNVGFLAGAFVAGGIARRMGVGRALIGASVLIGGGAILAPLATEATAVPLLVASFLIATFGGVIFNVNARSLYQSITPGRLLGRAIATLRVVVWGTIPLGAFLGGALGDSIGLRPTLWAAAAGGLLAFVPPLMSPVRRLVRMPAGPMGDADSDEPAVAPSDEAPVTPSVAPLRGPRSE
jgi:MFS family permease